MTIETLKKEIEELENLVSEDMPKEVMYDYLVQAYFKSKDIILLLEESLKTGASDEVQALKEQYTLASVQLDLANTDLQELEQKYKALEAKVHAALITLG